MSPVYTIPFHGIALCQEPLAWTQDKDIWKYTAYPSQWLVREWACDQSWTNYNPPLDLFTPVPNLASSSFSAVSDLNVSSSICICLKQFKWGPCVCHQNVLSIVKTSGSLVLRRHNFIVKGFLYSFSNVFQSFVNFICGSAGDWTQGFMHGRQSILPLNYSFSCGHFVLWDYKIDMSMVLIL